MSAGDLYEGEGEEYESDYEDQPRVGYLTGRAAVLARYQARTEDAAGDTACLFKNRSWPPRSWR